MLLATEACFHLSGKQLLNSDDRNSTSRMSFEKHCRNFLFAEKHLQNLTLSTVLSIQDLKKVWYQTMSLQRL